MHILVHALRARLGRKLRPRRVVSVEHPDDLVEFAHWADRPPLRMMVSPDLLRMQGGFVYGPNHPFVAALRGGEDVFRQFYGAVQPKTISEYYGLEDGGRTGASLPPWEIPWYGRKQRRPPPGELNLEASHGVSFYGPATEQKVELELSRLTRLSASLNRVGYDPDAFGDIEGYVLRDGNRTAFFVRGGKHRTAVLTHLGMEKIPVAFRGNFPRLIDSAQAEMWPLVRSGAMDVALAKDILSVYMQGQTVWDSSA